MRKNRKHQSVTPVSSPVIASTKTVEQDVFCCASGSLCLSSCLSSGLLHVWIIGQASTAPLPSQRRGGRLETCGPSTVLHVVEAPTRFVWAVHVLQALGCTQLAEQQAGHKYRRGYEIWQMLPAKCEVVENLVDFWVWCTEKIFSRWFWVGGSVGQRHSV